MKFDAEVALILNKIQSQNDPEPTREYAFTHAITFYNRNQYFEAHEIFEFQWKKEKGHQKIYIQALIQICISMNKVFIKVNHVGALSQAKLAREKLLLLLENNYTIEIHNYLQDLVVSLNKWIDWLIANNTDNDNKPQVIDLKNISNLE